MRITRLDKERNETVKKKFGIEKIVSGKETLSKLVDKSFKSNI